MASTLSPAPSNGDNDDARLKIYFLPNLLTAGNLFCGFVALTKIVEADISTGIYTKIWTALYFILAACIFDLFDGRVARMGGAESPFGREFDSLADLISFGAAPAFLVHRIVLKDVFVEYAEIGWFIASIYLVCGAFRLARYNVMSSQPSPGGGKEFLGFPIPSAAGLVASLAVLDTRMGDPAQQASLDAAITAIGTIQTDMAQETSVQSVVTAVGNLQTGLTVLNAAVGTPAQAAALASVDGKVDAVQAAIAALPGATDYTPQLTALQGGVDALATTLGTPTTSSIATDIAAIPGATDYTPMLTTIQADLTTLAGQVNNPAQAVKLQQVQDAVNAISSQIAALPATAGANYSSNFTALDTALSQLSAAVSALKTDVASTQTSVASVGTAVSSIPTTASTATTSTAALETATLLAKLNELQKDVQSASGSSAAVGMAQGAYSAASEALKILQQIQDNIQQNGGVGNPQVPVMLGKFGEQMKQVSTSVSVLPGQISEDAEVLAQIKKLTEQAKGIASDKGYAFDSLYEISETQAGDVKTMRNQVEELKALVEMQRALLEKNMNQPVMKTWFEAR